MSLGRVEVATTVDGAFCRVIDQANAQTAVRFRQYCSACIARGHTRFIVDLAFCRGMDSTFMGTLVGLSTEITQSRQPVELILCNATQHVRMQLTNLGVASLVSMRDEPVEFPDDALTALPDYAATDKRKLKVIRAAHESLMQISQDNQARFGPFVRGLAKEMEQMESEELLPFGLDQGQDLPSITPPLHPPEPLPGQTPPPYRPHPPGKLPPKR